MKKIMCMAMVLAASSAYGAILTCAQNITNGGGAINVLSIEDGACTVLTAAGELTFANFNVNPVGVNNAATTIVSLFNVLGTGTDNVALGFNPGLSSNGVWDLHFSFSVTGPLISAVSLYGGGATGSIRETVCSVPQDAFGGCPGSVLTSMTWTEGEGNIVSPITPTGTIYIWKDILVDSKDPGGDGHNSGFEQDFTTSSVPEPGSFALLGGGLMALGLVARRRRS